MLLRRARTVVATIFATGCLCGGFARAAVADSGRAPTLQLVSQSATVVPSAPGAPTPFNIAVRVNGTPPAGSAIGLTFYNRLGSRSAFEESLSATPSGIMQRVAPVPISATVATGLTIPLAVTIAAGIAEPSGSKTVGLTRCRAGDDSCSGVYPVAVELLGADGSVVSHLTTFLTYAEKRSLGPIVFSWVAPIAAPVRIHPAAPVSSAVGPLKPSRVKDLAQLLGILARNPTVQVSVAASPATVEALGIDRSANARTTLVELRGFAAENPRRLIPQPYVPVNLASLSEAGLTTEIQGQTVRANSVMGAPSVLGGLPSADQPTASKVWLAQGSVSPSIGEGLNKVGARDLVLPDSDLPSATEEDHATWSQPFVLSIGRGITAAAEDTQLSSYFTADPRDPVLAANHLLAALAMIHFELPGAPDTRGVIAVPPTAWDPDPAFVSTLVAGLASNPVVTTATLDQFFGAVPIGGNQAAGTRHLQPGSASGQISASQAAAIATARKQIDGFVAAVKESQPPVENQLEDLLLASESSELSAGAQRAALAAFERQLGSQLSGISVVASTVTLTARTATVPITIVSSVGYKLKATLTLSSAKLQFPQGASRLVKIDHPTNTTNVQVRARTTGDLPLAFKLTSPASPGGTLLIERGQLTVRSTATSIVGIVLTLVAAVVLLAWWARTWRRGRRGRVGRPTRGAAT